MSACVWVEVIVPPIPNLSSEFHCLEKSASERDLLCLRLSTVTNFCLFLPTWLTISFWRRVVCGVLRWPRIWFWMCSGLCISITATLISLIDTFAPSTTHKKTKHEKTRKYCSCARTRFQKGLQTVSSMGTTWSSMWSIGFVFVSPCTCMIVVGCSSLNNTATSNHGQIWAQMCLLMS